MLTNWFVVHAGLLGAARFPGITRTRQGISAAEVALLLACGAGAAVTVGLVKLRLGIPGHAIVLAALPMALGLSVAPRHLAGSLMGLAACGTALALGGAGVASFGSGALVSLSLLGPTMDAALRRARHGRAVYAALVVSGIVANLLALSSRAAAKLLGLDLAGARAFDSWWLQAVATYTLSGAVAGLVGAVCWFQLQNRRRDGRPPA